MIVPVYGIVSKKLLGHIEITDDCWECEMLKEGIAISHGGTLRLYPATSLEITQDGPMQTVQQFLVSYEPSPPSVNALEIFDDLRK